MQKQFQIPLKVLFTALLTCVCCYNTSYGQKKESATTYVSVVPITRYNFRIINSSPLRFTVKITGVKNLNFELPPRSSKELPSNIVYRDTKMRIIYNEDEYLSVAKDCEQRELKLGKDKNRAERMLELEIEVLKQAAKDASVPVKVGAGVFILKKYSDKIDNIETSELSVGALKKINKDIYEASIGKKNEYYEDFNAFKLKPYVKVKMFMSPSFKLETAFRFNRKDHNEFWGKKGGDADWGISYAQRIGGEIQLGRKKRFLTLYAFGAWNKESYGLEGEGINSYFVDSSYVKFSKKTYYDLFTTDVVNLNINRWSAGLMTELYFYPGLFINARVGYNILNLSHIEFEKNNGKSEEVFHLESPFEFNSRKNDKAINFNGENFYGQVRLGLYLSDSGRNLPRKGYYITIGYELSPRTNYSFGEENGLYYFNQGQIENVPVNHTEQSDYISRFTWSLGLAF